LATSGATVIRLCEGPLGITWREWRVIASLGPNAAMLSSELAIKTHLDRARTSRAVTSLVAKKRVLRVPVPGDMRKATLSLTKKGQKLFEEFFPVVAALNAGLVQDLSEQELSTLDKVLVASQLQAENLLKLENQPKANRRLGGRRLRLQS
jgi:DNA-binding MarR family transcriptional regulator